MLHEADLSPIRYERVCQADGQPVPWREVVKGYEYSKGKYIVLTDDDFKAAALESSKVIDILDFVKQEEIDPRYFETPYFLLPAKGGEKAYALLREAIQRSASTGIGKIILRQKQHLVAVKVVGDALVLEIMRFANELVDIGDFDFPSREGIRPQELQMAEQLIANLAEPFDAARYTDEYRENLMRIIRAKMKGRKVKFEEPLREPADAAVIDLMSRLRESLEQGKAKPKSGAVRARRRTAAAREKKPSRRRKTA
jgi:DNA end-binding protein Ku